MDKPESAPRRIALAADHGGYELKAHIAGKLLEAGFRVADHGNTACEADDDYPDFVIPMARAVAAGEADRGLAFCGSGVGVCIAANKVPGARACLVQDTFAARQGVEDDDLNILCLGGLVTGHALAWELVRTFLAARFSGAARHRRRVAKVKALEPERAS